MVLQEFNSTRRHLLIVHLVGVQTVARQFEAYPVRALGPLQTSVIDFVRTEVIRAMVADVPFGETVKLIGPVEVHPTDLDRSIPSGPECMGKCRNP